MNEHLKHFLVSVGAVVVGVAAYNFLVQPLILSATTTSAPAAAAKTA
jgi:hypothetical protein